MPRSEKSHVSESSQLLNKQRKASASHKNVARKQRMEKSPHALTLLEEILMEYVSGIGLTLFFWCLGGLSLTTYIIAHFNGMWIDRNWGFENQKLHNLIGHYWVVMVFFWIGDIVAVWVLVRLLSTTCAFSHSISAEQGAAYQGILSDNMDRESEVCSSTDTPSSGGGMKSPYDVGIRNSRWLQPVTIPPELSLLLRHMLFRGCGGAVAVTLITITQVLVCYHLSRLEKGGSLHLLASLVPVIIVLSIALLRSFIIYSVGIPEMLSWLLILIQTIILGTGFSHFSWYILLSPLLMLDALIIVCLLWVSGGGIFGRLTLVKGQTLSLLMYIVAAVLCMVGQSMFFIVMQDLATPGTFRILDRMSLNRKQICIIGATLCWAGLSLFVASLYVTLRHKARECLGTQCFKDPQPLSCKDNGWGASGGGFEHWWLLGSVEVHSALKRQTARRSSGMPAGSSGYSSMSTAASIEGKQSINRNGSEDIYIQI